MADASRFFQVGGTLEEDAPSYVERPADQELIAALEEGELCLVLAPRQTGKSSLMVRAAKKLGQRTGYTCGLVDLQLLGSPENAECWFGDVVYQIERTLALETDSADWWESHGRIGPTQRFMTFLEDVVLGECQGKIVIFFDEVDSVLSLPFSDDFFTTIRAVYNARSTKPALRRLTFVLAGAASPSSFIKRKTRTPFNVGHEISLTDFRPEDSELFKRVLGEDSAPLIDHIFYWTDGQPYMVQRLAEKASRWNGAEHSPVRVDQEVESGFLQQEVEKERHLGPIRDLLLDKKNGNLRRRLKLYGQVLSDTPVEADERSQVQTELKLAGVVRAKEGKLQPRNRVYRRVFNEDWGEENTPRESYKFAATGLGAVLAIIAFWFVLQPVFFSRFPDVPRIVKYTPDPSAEIEISLQNTDVKAVQLVLHDSDTQTTTTKPIPIPDNRLIQISVAGLKVGENSQYALRLVAGFLEKAQEIPIQATYYPNWQVRTYPLARHTADVWSVTFSPDGKTLASGSSDDTIKLWNVDSGQELRTLTGHTATVWSVTFSPDGKTLASGSSDKFTRLWWVAREPSS